MEIIHACPGDVVTGGPESIHKIVSTLAKIKGVNAKIWYIDGGQPEPYKVYKCEYVTEVSQDYDGVIIFPEIWANRVCDYPNAIKVISWFGVNAYKWHLKNKDDFGKFLGYNVIHLCVSKYAEQYVKSLGVPEDKILRLACVLNAEYFKKYEEKERSDVILYNPAKQTDFGRKVIKYGEEFRQFQFKPLEGLTIHEMAETMRGHKLYIDFGIFPGRERIPREAVMCGCCVITSNLGAARYYEDVCIPEQYKFDCELVDITPVLDTMEYILENYEDCKWEWDEYRKNLINDKKILPKQCKELVEKLKEMTP